jgi:putative transposase
MSNVWDNAAMKSFFSSMKPSAHYAKCIAGSLMPADMSDCIERFYNPKRRHLTIGYIGPMEFEMRAGFSLRRCQAN